MKRRLLSLALALAMVLSVVPQWGFAEGDTGHVQDTPAFLEPDAPSENFVVLQMVENGTATVNYQADEAANLTVAVYSSDGSQMLFSATEQVEAGTGTLILDLGREVPESCKISVFLTAVGTNMALCANEDIYLAPSDPGEGGREWQMDGDTLIFEGSGEVRTTDWYTYRDSIRKVVIEEGYTSIANSAFSNMAALEEVVLPDTLVSIGGSAFTGCSRLTNVNFPEGLQSIGDSAFYGTGLKEVTLPETLTSIGTSVFCNCRSLTKVVFQAPVDEIPARIFSHCVLLRSVEIPGSFKGVGNAAFWNCFCLESFDLPEGLEYVADVAFAQCGGLQTITLPSTLKMVGDCTFQNCDCLQEVYYTGTREQLGKVTMEGSWLRPEKIICLGEAPDPILDPAFSLNDGVLTIASDIPDYTFSQRPGWNQIAWKITRVVLEENVSEIGAYAFSGLTELKEVVCQGKVSKIGANAFEGCDMLTEFQCSENGWREIGAAAFRGCSSLDEIPKASQIGAYAFADCTGLKKIEVASDDIEIATFQGCTGLEEAVIQEGTSYVGWSVFEGCTALTTVWLPESLRVINSDAFSNCPALRTIRYVGTKAQWEHVEIRGSLEENWKNVELVFEGGEGEKSYQWQIENGTLTITGTGELPSYGYSAQVRPEWYARREEIRRLVLEEGISKIGNYCFADLPNLETAQLPDSLEAFGDNVFEKCVSLKAIDIPENVYTLGNYTFSGCSNLTDVTLSQNIHWFQTGVFQNCTSLSHIDLPDWMQNVGDSMFSGCTALTEISLPEHLEGIGRRAFENCSALKTVAFSENMTSLRLIDVGAFSGCKKLEEITIPEGITQIAVETFQNCTGLKYVHLNKDLAGIGKDAFAGCTGIVAADYPGTWEEWEKVRVSEGNEYLNVTCADEASAQEALEELEPIETEPAETEPAETEPTETAPAVTEPVETEPIETEPIETEPIETEPTETEPAEEAAEEEAPELTSEEAAEMGYYVAPYGAAMEVGETLSMAAISGQEKTNGNVRTVSFTGLEKGEQYVLIVSLNPGDLDRDSLQYIAQSASWDGTLSFRYVPRQNVAAVVQLYGLSSQREVTLDREYLTMEPQGQAQQLTAKVIPEGWEEYLTWSSDNEEIARVENGLVIPGDPGTTYITATVDHNGYVFSARCRVDVRSAERLDHVEKGIDSLSTELYTTEYPTIPLRPIFNEEEGIAELAALNGAENSNLFASAEFKDAAAKAAFRLEVVDDQTLRVVPTEESLANAKTVKSSYKSGILLTTASGKQLEVTDKELTLSVKKNLPKLKTATLNFNSFYSGQTQPLLVPGVTVESMELEEDPKNPGWLTLTDGKLQLTENAPKKSASANVTLTVKAAEWAKDLILTVPVKLSYTAPKLKLSESKLTFANVAGQNVGRELYLYASSKGESLAQLGINGLVSDDPGFVVDSFEPSSGRFLLMPTQDNPCTAKTLTLLAQAEGTEETIPLKVALTWKEPTLRLSASTVSLQAENDQVLVSTSFDPVCISCQPVIRSVVRNGMDAAGELEVSSDDRGNLTVKATENTVAGATYKVSLDLNGKQKKPTVLTVKVATAKQKPSVTLKAWGTLDLAFPNNWISVEPTYKNFGGSDQITLRGKLLRGKTTIDMAQVEDYFGVNADRQWIDLCCNPGADLRAGDSVELEVDFGECTAKIKLPIKQTQAKLKLGVSSAILNPYVQDAVYIPFTSTTKNIRVTAPVVEVLNSKKQVVTDQFDIQIMDDYLLLSAEDTVDPGSYTVNVRASNAVDSKGKLVNANAAVKLTVPAEAKAKVTVSAKAQGTMDPTDSGMIQIVSQLKNMSRSLTAEDAPEVTVLETKGKIVTDVTDGFEWWQRGNLLTIEKLPGADMDPGKKYTVKLSYPSLYGEPAVTVNLPIKMAAAKLTAQSVTLYKNDPDGQAFLVLSGLTTGRKIARIETKDKNFELIDLSGGQYALAIKQGAAAKAKSGNVKLSVYLEGNGGATPNATVTLKVTVR